MLSYTLHFLVFINQCHLLWTEYLHKNRLKVNSEILQRNRNVSAPQLAVAVAEPATENTPPPTTISNLDLSFNLKILFGCCLLSAPPPLSSTRTVLITKCAMQCNQLMAISFDYAKWKCCTFLYLYLFFLLFFCFWIARTRAQ